MAKSTLDAFAKFNDLLEKKVKSKIEILDKNSKINEIARMLSGEEISLEAMSASKKLLEENNTK